MRNRKRFYELGLCVLNYGFAQGLSLFTKLKLKNTSHIKIDGVKYPIALRKGSSDALVFSQVFLLKEYDLDKDFGWPIPKEFPVIVDAGANVGLASIYFTNRYPKSKIVAIEAEKNNYNQLVENTKAYPNVQPIHAALWHQQEMLVLSNPDATNWGFMVEEQKSAPAEDAIQALTVLDIMEKFNLKHIDLLKIDIEGAEKEVFQHGAEKWIPKCSVIIVELHDRMKPDCTATFFKALEPYHFTVLISGENLICIKQQ